MEKFAVTAGAVALGLFVVSVLMIFLKPMLEGMMAEEAAPAPAPEEGS